jgi:hypothetical protein
MTAAVISLRSGEFADPARLEPVKWLAFVAMVCDHLGLTLLTGYPWLRDIGTFAFPAFALSFGIGLASSSDPLRVAKRLFWPAVAAQLCWLSIWGAWHPLNVLAVFALCALFPWVQQKHGEGRFIVTPAFLTLAGVVLLAVAYPKVEGGFMAFLLVGGAFMAARRSHWWMLPPVAVWAVLQPSVGFVLGVLAVLFMPRLPFVIPRRPGLLAFAYAGHLWLISTGLLFAQFKPQ